MIGTGGSKSKLRKCDTIPNPAPSSGQATPNQANSLIQNSLNNSNKSGKSLKYHRNRFKEIRPKEKKSTKKRKRTSENNPSLKYNTSDLDHLEVANIFNEKIFMKNLDSDKRISLSYVNQEYGTEFSHLSGNRNLIEKKPRTPKSKPPKIKNLSTDVNKVIFFLYLSFSLNKTKII